MPGQQERIEIIAELRDLVSSHLNDITSQVDRLDNSLRSAGSSGGGIFGSILGANLLTGAIQKAGSAVYDFGKESLQAYGQQEQFLVSLRTMFQGNQKEADALNARIIDFAKSTPFQLDEIQQATRLMIAYGSTSGGVVDEMRMLGDVSSGTAQPLNEIAYLYGTIRQQQKANHVDLKQFANRGIPIFKELAKVTKYSLHELVEGGKDVEVTFQDIQKAFKNMTAEGSQFHNMMTEQSKTLLGSWSNLEDAAGQLKSNIGEIFADISKEIVAYMTGAINTVVERLRAANQASSIFKKGGAGMERSWWESAQSLSMNLMVGHGDKYDKTQLKLNELVSNAKTEAQMHALKAELAKNRARIYQAEIDSREDAMFDPTHAHDQQDFARTQELLKDAMSTLDESLASMKREKQKIAEEDEAAKKAKSLETAAKANKPTQIVINIENLVREFEVVSNNIQEAPQKIQEMVAKVLISAVNDISVLRQ